MSTVYLISVGLLIICSYHDASAKKNRSPCLRNEFKCKEDGKCIPVHWRCDADFKGLVGCSDGGHKSNCGDNKCLEAEHRCGDGRCIPAAWVCDGRTHCFDRSDEKGCFPVTDRVCLRNQFRCTNGKCIPILYRCNGNNTDCSDGSDESKWCESWCPEGYVRCNNTTAPRKCIPKSYLCNGELDCPDKSDEKDCDKCEKWGCAHDCEDTPDGPQCLCKEGYRLNLKDKRTCLVKTNPVTCLRNQFACADGTQCAPMRHRCDVNAEKREACSDGSHMDDCDGHQCSEGEHRCGNGRCVPSTWVCDGRTQCIDESDELLCAFNDRIQDPVCLRNQFRCSDGYNCIPIHERCNGFGTAGGCPDHSDELQCPENWCPEGYLRCDKAMNDGAGSCIRKSLFCDGETDCEDESDEKDCDKCENWGCSHYCKETLPWPKCLCKDGYKLDDKEKRNCTIIGK